MLKKDRYAKSKETWCGINNPHLSEKQVDVVVFGIPFAAWASSRARGFDAP